MENILRPVQEAFPKLFINKQKSPSYVKMYTRNDDDIVLVCIKNKQYSNDNKNQAVEKQSEELDLTGSPLKLDLSLHAILDDTLISDEPQLWSKEESWHYPVGIEKAREVANLYNGLLTKLTPEESIPMWIVTNPSDEGKPLLLTVQSDSHHFARGIVSYEDAVLLEDMEVNNLVQNYAKQEEINSNMVNTVVDCKFLLSGISYGSHTTEELLNAPHNGVTELRCEWQGETLQTPFLSCDVNFEQEVIVGHLSSPCHAIWKSVSALHNLNQLLVDITAAGCNSVNLKTSAIRNTVPGARIKNNSKLLNDLLNETETYAYTAECPAGGCICVTDDTTSLKQSLGVSNKIGSSNDFTYKLWDVLRESESAEELITLLIQALKFISTGNIRPFIDANNKTFLSKLVLKLSRGHSQASKVLKNLRTSPPQSLSLVAQVGIEKTMWEYTKLMSLVEHSFYIAGIWTTETRTQESIEQINQTIQDMTMGGDFSLNPFDNLTSAENSIRLDCESFYVEDAHELTVDDFASLKKHGLVNEKKDINEVPLIADEIDISPWKNILMKFAQVHVCLEHLSRTETCLRADFANLKPIASRLIEYYVSEKSPIRTIGQLLSDPVQSFSMTINNNIVQEHLKKPALWYRLEMTRKENAKDAGIKRDSKVVHLFTQLPVFPPGVWQILEPSVEDAAEITTIGEELKYHHTKYVYLNNEVRAKITL